MAFCHVPGVRSSLVGILLGMGRLGDRGGAEGRQGQRERVVGGKEFPLFLSLLNWACQSADAHWTATFNALELLQEVFEVCHTLECVHMLTDI